MKITVSMEDVRQSASYLKQKANEYDAVVRKNLYNDASIRSHLERKR